MPSRYQCRLCGYRYTHHDEAYGHWLREHSR